MLLVDRGALACGKKGPPLAPFQRVPAAVTAVTALRVGDDVYLSFTVPATNVDGQKPADIEVVEVYGVTAANARRTEEQRELATLIATLPVRPILPELPAANVGTAALPLPPGVDRGAVAVAKRSPPRPESRSNCRRKTARSPSSRRPTSTAGRPWSRPRRRAAAPPLLRGRRRARAAAWRAVDPDLDSARGRQLGAGRSGVTNTASDMTITWPPSPDARDIDDSSCRRR